MPLLICTKYFAVIFLLCYCLTNGQTLNPKQLDSLEQVLLQVDKNNTAEIVQRAEYLIKHTDSRKQQCYLLGIIVSAYSIKNDKERSIHYLFRAKKIAEEAGDSELTTKVYTTLASMYGSLNLNDKARLYLNKSRSLIDKMPHGRDKSKLLAFNFTEWGNFHYNNKDYKEANRVYRNALSELKKPLSLRKPSPDFYQRALLHKYGNSFLHLNQTDSAEYYLIEAFNIKDTLYPEFRHQINISLSEVFTERKDYRRSNDTLTKMLMDSSFNVNDLKATAYLNLARNYKLLGNVKKYSLYNEKYLELSPVAKTEDMRAINTVFNVEHSNYETLLSESHKRTLIIILAALVFVAVTVIVAYVLHRRKKRDILIHKSIIEKLERTLAIEKTPLKDTTRSTSQQHGVSPTVEADITSKLMGFEASEKFTNPKLTISMLAVEFETNTTYLSDVINTSKGKNFNTYINELRVDYICKKIHSTPEYHNYKISYLAETCGFTSHSAFATVFKSVTGISPSTFLKQTKKDNIK